MIARSDGPGVFRKRTTTVFYRTVKTDVKRPKNGLRETTLET
jgi:hypothetical protein